MSEQSTHNAHREAGAVITFAEGLVGLPELKRWILVDMDPPLPMKWLQSLDREGFRVPVTDPGFYAGDYGFEISEEAQAALEAMSPEQQAARALMEGTIQRMKPEVRSQIMALLSLLSLPSLLSLLTDDLPPLH